MNILVIENDLILLTAITRVYKSEHEVTPVSSLDEALELIKTTKYDLITIDLRMNGKNRSGLEAYFLAREKWPPNLPIVVITGCDDEMLDNAKQYLDIDPSYLVYQKPINFSTLEDIITFGNSKLDL